MTVTLAHAETTARRLAEFCSDADVKPSEVAREWRLEFASWTDGELTAATERWLDEHGSEMLPAFPKPADLRRHRPDAVKDARDLKTQRVSCICDGDGMVTRQADSTLGGNRGWTGGRQMHGVASETVVHPCYYCNRVRFEVWYFEVVGEAWNGNMAPEWAAEPRPAA